MLDFMKLIGVHVNKRPAVVNRAKRFLRSLSHKTLDEAWAVLTEDASESWRSIDTGAMLEKAYKIKRKDPKEQQAVNLMLAIAKSRESEAVALVSREGMDFMQPQWMANCLLATELANQWALTEAIVMAIIANKDLLHGAGEVGSRPGSLAMPAGDVSESAVGNIKKKRDPLTSTALLVDVERPRSRMKIASLLVAHGVGLGGSGKVLSDERDGEPVFKNAARQEKRISVDGNSDQALLLNYACEGVGRENLLLSLIERFQREGPRGGGWQILSSMNVLAKVVHWERDEAAAALIGDGAPQATSVGVEPLDVAQLLRRMIMSNMNLSAERLVLAISSIGGPLLEALNLSNPNAKNGPPPLALAIGKGNADLAAVLVACGANCSVKAVSQEDLESGAESLVAKSMLEMAAERGLERVIYKMIQMVGLGEPSKAFIVENDGARLAREAMARGFPEVAIALLRGGAGLLDEPEAKVSSAMLWTAGSVRAQVAVIQLLRNEPAEARAAAFEALDEHGRGALARAAFGESQGLVKTLLAEGANVAAADAQLQGHKEQLDRLRSILCESAISLANPLVGIESVAEKVRLKMRHALDRPALSTSKRIHPER